MIEKHGKQASLYRGYRYDRKARKTNITIPRIPIYDRENAKENRKARKITIFITYDREARKTSITILRIPI